ncbi:hypothetical protein GPROT2_03902 [Gammaproteobacteria bacterium]|nr:hypothetical protein GPROT2_03902 [Gammaproteobacteria bacterium]
MNPHVAPAPSATLVVGHWPAAALAPGGATGIANAWRIDTCLRSVLVAADPAAAHAITALGPPELQRGGGAYAFLLEFACGLLSAIPGETNVFGQVRRAWEAFRDSAPPPAVRSLAPVAAALLQNTRAIRSARLTHIGGASYGGLVRRLLSPAPAQPLLIVGAGELARSLLPFFRAQAIGTWSRRPAGAPFAAAGRVFPADAGAEAARWARHVVMTTPADPTHDRQWFDWLESGPAQTLVHLGRRRGSGQPWPAAVRGYDLDDVFDLRRSQDRIRSLQVERARQDCRQRARAWAAAAASAAGMTRWPQRAAG